MGITVSIDQSGLDWINALPGNFKTGYYRGIRDAMLFAEDKAKDSFGKVGKLKVKTGKLRSSIIGESDEDRGSLHSNVIYAPVHEFGKVINAKSARGLRYQIGGVWKRSKQVIIPERPFLRPAFEDNMDEIANIITDAIIGDMANG